MSDVRREGPHSRPLSEREIQLSGDILLVLLARNPDGKYPMHPRTAVANAMDYVMELRIAQEQL